MKVVLLSLEDILESMEEQEDDMVQSYEEYANYLYNVGAFEDLMDDHDLGYRDYTGLMRIIEDSAASQGITLVGLEEFDSQEFFEELYATVEEYIDVA